MSFALKIGVTALAGAALGLGATWMSLEHGFSVEHLQAGAWRSQPQVAGNNADPYARAFVSRNGQAPMGAAEGLSFTASQDSAGDKLRTACSYKFSGPVPAARAWSVSTFAPDGTPLHTGERRGFTSSELLRDGHGDFSIALSHAARPGNWLPLPQDGDFVLLLRLYDTARAMSATTLSASDLPKIVKERCP